MIAIHQLENKLLRILRQLIPTIYILILTWAYFFVIIFCDQLIHEKVIFYIFRYLGAKIIYYVFNLVV